MIPFDNLKDLYNNTLKNCRFYEAEEMYNSLLNEVGVLRGVAYALEISGDCPHNADLAHFIEYQNEFTKAERDRKRERANK